MSWPAPLESDALDRRHTLFAWALGFEAAVSFAVPVALLLLGTLYFPAVLAGWLSDPQGGSPQLWAFVAMLTSGTRSSRVA